MGQTLNGSGPSCVSGRYAGAVDPVHNTEEPMDKWQQRQVQRHAEDNGVSEADAVRELFPAEAPARKSPARKSAEGGAPEAPKE